MKSLKKQVKPKATKQDVIEKDETAGIRTFFKSAPKTFSVGKNIPEAKTDDGDRVYFVGALKEKLRIIHGEATGKKPIDEASPAAFREVQQEEKHCNDLPLSEPQIESSGVPTTNCSNCAQKDLAIREWERKYSELKKLYAKQSIHFSELYSKHNDLLKTVESINTPAAEEEATSTDIFTPSEVKFLQCMDPSKKKDCTFVHHCLNFAYKSEPSVMASRTLWGTASWTGTKNGEQIHREAKSPLTPEKVRRIKALFVDRISKCRIDSAEYAERMKEPYVNKLIAAGIKNLSQKKN